MTRKCCIPNCRSNYLSERKNGTVSTILTFSFPKDEELCKKWIKKIPRDGWQPGEHSYVCVKHFDETEIEYVQRFTNKDGKVIEVLLRYPKLKAGGFPHMFQNLPAYLTTSLPNQRKDPEKRREAEREREEKAITDFLKKDVIQNFEDFRDNYVKKLDTMTSSKYWRSVIKPDSIIFYLLNVNVEFMEFESLEILAQIVVRSDLTITVFKKTIPVETNDLKWIIDGNKLSKWSQIENMLSAFKNESFNIEDSTKIRHYLKLAILYLEKVQKMNDDNVIALLLGQLRLFGGTKKNYDSTTMVFAFMIFNNSRSTYKLLKTFLSLPTVRHLQNIISSADTSPANKDTNNGYLKHIFAKLNDREKIISLLLDEIYVTPTLTYKSNSIAGHAVNNSGKLARTVMMFMITSCFGGCKEVVKLVPVNNLSAEQIHEIVVKVISELQGIGFKILTIISDNNRVNQNLFKRLGTDLFFDNPSYSGEKIFVMYDTVHIFKNVRNNWLNLKSIGKCFEYPNFDDFSQTKAASFQHLREYHENEAKSILKNAYKLNRKTLHPNNLERQNVTMVNNVFHDSTIAALKSDSKYKDTANFLQIIRNWWNTVNVKNTTKGVHLRLEFSTPVTSVDDDKINFLRKFLDWLKVWKTCNGGKLTNDTHEAIIHSTSVLIELITYSFNVFHVEYVLLGKFQTDPLECRFGEYRRVSGNSHSVSFMQILEAEKRIRLRHIMKDENFKDYLKSLSKNKDDDDVDEKNKTVKVGELESILYTDYLVSSEVSSSLSFEYVCGVAAHSVKERLHEEAKRKQPIIETLNEPACTECTSLVLADKGSVIGNPYFDELQRGGLCIATEQVKDILKHTCAIMEGMKNDPVTYDMFLRQENQGAVLLQLVRLSVEHNGNGVMVCSIHGDRVFKIVTSTFKNIVLNNFCKIINNVVTTEPKKRKLKTLTTTNGATNKNLDEPECKKLKVQDDVKKVRARKPKKPKATKSDVENVNPEKPRKPRKPKTQIIDLENVPKTET